jgi:DivIVA domain-containing protein
MISRIQNARFSTTRLGGYDERQVDDFLDLLIQILGSRGSLDPMVVRSATFEVARLRPCYVKADVDALLDEVERYASGYS